MSSMKLVKINHKWDLKVPEIREKALPWSVWEKERLAAMHKVIRKGDVVLDIGTEFGDMTALYSKWSGGNVILAEPAINYWVYIKEIFEANNCPPPISSFVGFVGKEHRYDYVGSGYPPEVNLPHTVEGDEGFGFRHLNEQGDSIPTITIDEISKIRKLDIVNMDIEGAEYQALLGAQKVLKEDRPIWFISVHPAFMYDRYKNTFDDLIHLMELNNYETTFLGEDHESHYMFKPL